jgi:photosystem II stability/assembly factor-like uncharacterized protein
MKTHSFAPLVRIACAALGLALAGCARSPEAGTDLGHKVIEGRDAFYDGARLGEKIIIVVGKHGKILRSDDTGESWVIISSNVDHPLFSVAFSDQTHGAIVGAGGTFLESADGGLTWKPRSLGIDRQLFLVRFVQGGTGFIVGEFGTLLRTETGGKDWQAIELNWEQLLPELVDTLGLVEPHLYHVAFCDPSHGWAVGEYGLILSSQDYGRTWQKRRGGGLFDKHLFVVTCAGPGRVVAAGQGGEILYSGDGGGTWTPAPSPRGQDIYDLVPLSPGGGLLALGDLGTLLKSSDAGSPGSWTPFAGSPQGEAAKLGHSWLARGLPSPPGMLVLGEAGVSRLDVPGAAGT